MPAVAPDLSAPTDLSASADLSMVDLSAADQASADLAPDDSGLVDGSVAGGTTPAKQGNVFALNTNLATETSAKASASFEELAASGIACTYSPTASALCQREQCTGLSNNPVFDDGGTVTFSDGTRNATLTWNGTAYPFFSALGSNWTTGATISISSSGSSKVPAFSDTVVMPPPADFSAPLPDSHGNLTQSRTSDFNFAWSGGGSQFVSVFLSTGSTSTADSVRCVFPAPAGAGAIPSAVLSTLSAGTYSLSAQAGDYHDLVIGDWSITVAAVGSTRLPGMTNFQAMVALQ